MDRVFGYGSLVNRATHTYPGARPAQLAGWRRVWVHTTLRPVAYLSVQPGDGSILGLLAEVPGGDWAALDAREAAYARHAVTAMGPGGPEAAQVYAVPTGAAHAPQAAHPIMQSYLDCVVQGFLREFGPAGAADFFATTDGWEAPILDDRAAPVYSRAQSLTARERDFVDAALCRFRRG